jgi:hypothetical protein
MTPPMQPCRRCKQPVVFQTPQCPHCGLVFAGLPGQDDATMRALLPVGRTPLSIIAGYVGLLSFLVVPAPLALILGILAVLDLRKQPGKHGMGRAVFAIVMGVLGTIALVALALG